MVKKMVKKMKKEKELVEDVIMVENAADFCAIGENIRESLKAGKIEEIKTVEVIEDIKLSDWEYRELIKSFPKGDNKMFSGKGGVNKDGIAKTIRIICQNHETLFINPEGYDYARYVGLSLRDVISHDACLAYKNKIKDKELFFNKIEDKENEKNK
jgi:hypothetical protein